MRSLLIVRMDNISHIRWIWVQCQLVERFWVGGQSLALGDHYWGPTCKPPRDSVMHAQAHIFTQTHAQHMCAHSHTLRDILTRTHMHTHTALTDTHMHTYTETHIHMHMTTYTRAYTHDTCTQTHTHISKHTCNEIQAYRQQRHTHMHTHTHSHTQTYTLTHTHTRKHTYTRTRHPLPLPLRRPQWSGQHTPDRGGESPAKSSFSSAAWSPSRLFRWLVCWELWRSASLYMSSVRVVLLGSLAIHHQILCDTDSKHPAWQDRILKVFQAWGTGLIFLLLPEKTFCPGGCGFVWSPPACLL